MLANEPFQHFYRFVGQFILEVDGVLHFLSANDEMRFSTDFDKVAIEMKVNEICQA